jgi:hypothetical protein
VDMNVEGNEGRVDGWDIWLVGGDFVGWRNVGDIVVWRKFRSGLRYYCELSVLWICNFCRDRAFL